MLGLAAQQTDGQKWIEYTIRMANEGIPLSAMARALGVPSGAVRRTLDNALQLGKILSIPPDDWPPMGPRKPRRQSAGAARTWLQRIGDDLLTLHCIRVFKLTPLQASVFSMLLRHNDVTKEMIHNMIEHRRQQKGARSTLEETDLKMVDVVICHIRRKLKAYNDGQSPVLTVWGSGYYIPGEFKLKATRMIQSYEA